MMATTTEIMKQLKSLGSERFRATFARHEITGDVFGVPYADLYKLQKAIGTDQALAAQLWSTGNHDARILATLIADPAQMKASLLDAWAKTATNPLSLDSIAQLAAKSPAGVTCMKKWMKSKKEWTAAAGWHLLAALASNPKADGVSAADLAGYLEHIEANIHQSPNRVRYSMNNALIAIGLVGPALEKKAIAAAKRIGTVEVDHGDTSCKTPDAATYIRKAADRRKQRPTPRAKTAGAKKAAKKSKARAAARR